MHPPYSSLDLNGESDVFNFSAESEREIEVWLKKYPTNYKKSALIPLLFIAQKQNNNFVSLGAMNKIAQILEIPPIDVYEVASFYTMFNRTKVGKFHLQVCGTTPCMVCGAERIIKVLEKHLGVHVGETTQDMMFTLSEVECLGACVNAPMLQINNEWVYEDLTEENVIELIEKLKRGEEVKKGPQNHRVNSEGPLGRTSLKDVNSLIGEKHLHTRDFAKAKEDWLKAKEAAEKAAAEKAAADKAAKEKAEAEKKAKETPAPLEDKKEAKPAGTGSPATQAPSTPTGATPAMAKDEQNQKPVTPGSFSGPAPVPGQPGAPSSGKPAADPPGPGPRSEARVDLSDKALEQAQKQEKERIQKETEEKARAEKANQEKREQAEKERLQKEKAEREKAEELRKQNEAALKQKQEADRLAKEKQARAAEAERLRKEEEQKKAAQDQQAADRKKKVSKETAKAAPDTSKKGKGK